MKKLANKTALIIGGSRGIGFATAKLFVAEGASVIITSRNDADLQAAVNEIGPKATFIQSDAGSLADTQNLFSTLQAKKITLHTVFINAGIAEGTFLDECTEEMFDKQFDINFKGAFFIAKYCLPFLDAHASIIFNASVAGIMGVENLSVYSATKAGLLSLTKSLATDLARKGIRVNAISPGFIKTPLGMTNNKEQYDKICASIPFENRFGTAEEVAQVALFLASDMASYITGANIVVDGGLSTPTL